MPFVSATLNLPSFESYTLVLPAVSTGNVGQLCVDVLLSTYDVKKIGYFHDPNVEPMVGNDALAVSPNNICGQLSLPVEVFLCESYHLVIVQQRAPCLKGCHSLFVNNMTSWIKEARFSGVVLLSSTFAFTRQDHHLLNTHQFRYLCTEEEKKSRNILMTILQKLRWPIFDTSTSLAKKQTYSSECDFGDFVITTKRSGNEKHPMDQLQGSGITKHMFRICSEKRIRLFVLVFFASEGENSKEGLTLASVFHKYLQLLRAHNVCTKSQNIPTTLKMNPTLTPSSTTTMTSSFSQKIQPMKTKKENKPNRSNTNKKEKKKENNDSNSVNIEKNGVKEILGTEKEKKIKMPGLKMQTAQLEEEKLIRKILEIAAKAYEGKQEKPQIGDEDELMIEQSPDGAKSMWQVPLTWAHSFGAPPDPSLY